MLIGGVETCLSAIFKDRAAIDWLKTIRIDAQISVSPAWLVRSARRRFPSLSKSHPAIRSVFLRNNVFSPVESVS